MKSQRSTFMGRMTAPSGRTSLAALALFCMAVVTGCGSSPVADDLSQRDANQIVAVLRGKGVASSTEKERGSRGRYSVVVSSSDFGKAAALLSELGLPSERKASFTEMVAQSGFLPSSREVESLRLDRALAAELEDLILGHPAVTAVHVVVRYHSVAGQSTTPSISVVAQVKADGALAPPVVRDMVSRAIPGVRPEDIVVSLAAQAVQGSVSAATSDASDSLTPFLVFWRVPAGEYNGLAGLLIGLLILVAGLAGLGGYIFGQYTLSKQQATRSASVLGGGAPVTQLAAPAGDDDLTEDDA